MNNPSAPPPSPDSSAAWAAAEAAAAAELAAADTRATEAAARRAAGGGPAASRSGGPVRRGRRRQLITAVAILMCAIGGAAASQALVAKPPAAPEEAAGGPEETPDAAAAPAKPVPESALGARVDAHIGCGAFADALKMLRDAPPHLYGDEYLTTYREGLCLEGLGRTKEADAAYQKAEKDPSVGGWARALLGRARCALAEGEVPTARRFVDRVALRSGHPECRGVRAFEEAVYLRARVAVHELGAPAALDPLDADALAWPSLVVAPGAYLEWLTADAPAVSPNPEPGRDVIELHPEKDPRNPEVTLRLAKRPALDVVRALATAAELELQVEPPVANMLAEAVGPVEVDRMPFDCVLSALTERAGVAWAVKGGTLCLTVAPRGTGSDAAGLALRKAVEVAPEHPAAGALRVALANLDYRAGRPRAAALGYKQVLESTGNPPELTHAAYNLGLMEMKAGNRKSAVSRFLEVIDRSPNTRFAEFGWCWVGRTHLDGDDPGAARQAYRAAFDGKNKEASSAAALGVCVCDLLTGNDDAARELVEEARFSTRESHAAVAHFFEALFRYRAAPTESRRELLIRALGAADELRGVGPGGVYFAGRVYADLGLPRQTTALYEREVETARGPLALRMLFDVAERYDRLDQRAKARTGYLALAAVEPEGLGGRAELKLAALDARDGNGADAVRRCRALVKNKSVPRDELLAVMGQGYELQKMYGAAAECFAGKLPE